MYVCIMQSQIFQLDQETERNATVTLRGLDMTNAAIAERIKDLDSSKMSIVQLKTLEQQLSKDTVVSINSDRVIMKLVCMYMYVHVCVYVCKLTFYLFIFNCRRNSCCLVRNLRVNTQILQGTYSMHNGFFFHCSVFPHTAKASA